MSNYKSVCFSPTPLFDLRRTRPGKYSTFISSTHSTNVECASQGSLYISNWGSGAAVGWGAGGRGREMQATLWRANLRQSWLLKGALEHGCLLSFAHHCHMLYRTCNTGKHALNTALTPPHFSCNKIHLRIMCYIKLVCPSIKRAKTNIFDGYYNFYIVYFNSQTIKFTLLKCTIQFSAYSQSCAITSTI